MLPWLQSLSAMSWAELQARRMMHRDGFFVTGTSCFFDIVETATVLEAPGVAEGEIAATRIVTLTAATMSAAANCTNRAVGDCVVRSGIMDQDGSGAAVGAPRFTTNDDQGGVDGSETGCAATGATHVQNGTPSGTCNAAVIGTTGFREVDPVAKTAEWGIIVSKAYQRRGICAESYRLCVAEARRRGLRRVTAATTEANIGMLSFLASVGMARTGVVHDDSWVEFGTPI
jgi:hypothetical protein